MSRPPATPSPTPAGAPGRAPGRAGPAALVAAQAGPGLAVAVVVAVALTALSGSETFVRLGLPDPGAVVTYGLPAVKAVAEGASVVAVGALVLAAFLVPPTTGRWLEADGYRAMRVATGAAALWAAAAAVMVPLSVADAFGQPVASVLGVGSLVDAVPNLADASAWALTAVAALATLAVARATLSWGWAVGGLVLAVVGLLPVALTGHSASGGNHDVAGNSLVLHVVAASVWVGGLVALLVHLAAGGGHPGVAVRRFSRLALVAWAAMGLTGLLNAAVRVSVSDLLTSTYGVLLLGKVVALVALGGFGAWHRSRTVPAVTAGSSGSLLRLGAVEVLVMAATVGLAVALGRTPPPAGATRLPTRLEALVGYSLDGPLTVGGLITEARFDVMFGSLALVLAAVYLVGVRRAGGRWSGARTASWLGGCLVLLVATSSGIGRYAPAVLSAHVVEHMALVAVVPLLLVLGDPAGLAARVVPAAPDGEPPGPREWGPLLAGGSLVRALRHPAVVTVLAAGLPPLLYFSGLYDVMLRSHGAHLAVNAALLGVGLLLASVALGGGAGRAVRAVALVVVAAADVVVGVVFRTSPPTIGASFYGQLGLPWVDRAADQVAAGLAVWMLGALPTLLVVVLVLVRPGTPRPAPVPTDGRGVADRV